jgi:hypothetical protein
VRPETIKENVACLSDMERKHVRADRGASDDPIRGVIGIAKGRRAASSNHDDDSLGD